MTSNELLNRLSIKNNIIFYSETQKKVILEAMEKYAHLMCEKQKEICADNAEADYVDLRDGDQFAGDVELYVIKSTILNCKNATEI